MPEGKVLGLGMEKMTAGEKAELHDRVRKSIARPSRYDRVMLTCGIMALGQDAVNEAVKAVVTFEDFDTERNDPYGEHDFGSFDLSNGEKVFWKIDDYNGHDEIRCVLTVLLEDEY